MPLLLFPLLHTLDPELRPELTKIHLATSNGTDQPLNEFLQGRFDAWQARQTRKNFERRHVVSLIQHGPRRWLFAGAYDSNACRPHATSGYWYDLSVRLACASLSGRVVITYERSGRASYLLADRINDALSVEAILPERYAVQEFPGFLKVRITKEKLDLIVRTEPATWRAALGAVKGIYLIADVNTGRHYVGKASGAGGIWERWSSYSRTGHGGNRDLMALLKREGAEYARHFQFAILEVADSNTGELEIDTRESHWKLALGTRDHGYNAN